jgi:hypothetical protein
VATRKQAYRMTIVESIPDDRRGSHIVKPKLKRGSAPYFVSRFINSGSQYAEINYKNSWQSCVSGLRATIKKHDFGDKAKVVTRLTPGGQTRIFLVRQPDQRTAGSELREGK